MADGLQHTQSPHLPVKAGQSIIIYNTVYSGQLYTVTCSIINIISLFRSVCLRAAIMLYSCCTIGSKVYMFGGNCMTVTTIIDLFMMDTLSDKWSQMEYSNSSSTSPVKKLGHGMMSIRTNNKKECLLVIGGYGPTPTSTTPNAEYIPNPTRPS